jgi:hypothetical protein
MLVELANDGYSYEDISTKYIPHKTPEQCSTYHHNLLALSVQGTENPMTGVRHKDIQVAEDETNVDDRRDTTPTPRGLMPLTLTLGSSSRPTTTTTPSGKKSQAPNNHLQNLRTQVIASIERGYITNGGRTKLKNTFNKRGWPKRFTSVAAYNAPPANKGQGWPPEDSQALMIIMEVAEKIPMRVLVEKFFQGRSENAVRNHYRTLVKAGKARSH